MAGGNINVIGVGYVGSVIALHLVRQGRDVITVDTDAGVEDRDAWFSRHDDLAATAGNSDLDRITTTTDYDDVADDVSVVCVDTPADDDGIDLSNIRAALSDLGDRIGPGHTVIVRSTVLPGTTRTELLPLLEERSGLTYGDDLHLCYAPEFMRGGAGFDDLQDPPKTVVAGDRHGIDTFMELFPASDNHHETSIETAEAVKIFDNVFHGMKISIANEAGRLGAGIGFDPVAVMDIISSDTRLNVSDMYLDPGNAFGGPCLPKDIEMVMRAAEAAGIDTPVIRAINESNDSHARWLAEQVDETEAGTVGIIGATYKEGFDSVANSPCLDIAAYLEQRGHTVLVHDPLVTVDGFRQVGIRELQDADVWIVFNQIDGLRAAREAYEGKVIDLSDFTFDV